MKKNFFYLFLQTRICLAEESNALVVSAYLNAMSEDDMSLLDCGSCLDWSSYAVRKLPYCSTTII